MPQRRPTVHWVLLLGTVQEHGTADAVPHHGKGPVRGLPERRGSACNRPACFTPALPIADIFILTVDIAAGSGGGGARGRAGGRSIPRDGGGRGGGAGEIIRDGGGVTRSKTAASKRKTAATEMTAARASGIRNEPKSQVSSNRAVGKYRVEGTDQEESAYW